MRRGEEKLAPKRKGSSLSSPRTSETMDVALYSNLVDYVKRDSVLLLKLNLQGACRTRDKRLFHAPDSRDPLLIIAADSGSVRCMRLLLPLSWDGEAIQALIHAARKGHAEIVAELIVHGVPVDAKGSSGATAMYEAVKYGHAQTIAILLKHHANVLDVPEGSDPLLHNAVNNIDCMRHLLSHVDLEAINLEDGLTALHVAAKRGELEAMKLLISKGANVNSRSFSRSTPLHGAVLTMHPECVQALLEVEGIVVDAVDTHGHTPLHVAVSICDTFVAGLLAKKGANVHKKGASNSPLRMALQKNSRVLVVEFFPFIDWKVHGLETVEDFCRLSDLATGKKFFEVAVSCKWTPSLRDLINILPKCSDITFVGLIDEFFSLSRVDLSMLPVGSAAWSWLQNTLNKLSSKVIQDSEMEFRRCEELFSLLCTRVDEKVATMRVVCTELLSTWPGKQYLQESEEIIVSVCVDGLVNREDFEKNLASYRVALSSGLGNIGEISAIRSKDWISGFLLEQKKMFANVEEEFDRNALEALEQVRACHVRAALHQKEQHINLVANYVEANTALDTLFEVSRAQLIRLFCECVLIFLLSDFEASFALVAWLVLLALPRVREFFSRLMHPPDETDAEPFGNYLGDLCGPFANVHDNVVKVAAKNLGERTRIWIVGGPGSGKKTTVYQAVEELNQLREPENLLQVLFINAHEIAEGNSPTWTENRIRSLLRLKDTVIVVEHADSLAKKKKYYPANLLWAKVKMCPNIVGLSYEKSQEIGEGVEVKQLKKLSDQQKKALLLNELRKHSLLPHRDLNPSFPGKMSLGEFVTRVRRYVTKMRKDDVWVVNQSTWSKYQFILKNENGTLF